ncbi:MULTISPECIES: lipopolysaccharide biosynthesis protein [unclassified Streptomyces]|uniref:lipopolysaccharide biosynthesis protein n=1 Tax=unclassified Streptomyces TaxID=2593676 RepID=UPI002E128C2E|nr:lipopolysaccharide biosynthesis protein [Streptomyces sp. NBC_01197]WSS52825.1 lipopolysaccharide biosynthesis protein [Streptomyces sp. NBC_01180]
MTDTHASAARDDEPDLLRDQFRQLLRYRRLIGLGIGVGLLGGAWLGVTSAESYAAASDIRLRAPTNDPFNPALSVDKTINMGTERQTAVSSSVAEVAVKALGLPDSQLAAFQRGLQVTNPPQTMVLHFTYTATSPGEAARRANAVTKAYLDLRKKQWGDLRDSMVTKSQNQLNPIAKEQNDLAKQLAAEGSSAPDSSRARNDDLLSKVGTLNSQIASLKALDMTAGTVIVKAVPPTASSGLGLIVSLGVGGAVGIALGLLAAWVRLVFDPSPRSAGDVARAVRAPVLGTLPRVGDGGPLLAVDQSDSRLAEEYRSVAFRLAYDQRFADRRRLLVAAPRGGNSEAAAAVAANLAASFAETGKDVLLVEADLRTPSLTARLRANSPSRPGWSLPPDFDESGWPGPRQLQVDAGESGAFDLIPGERVRNVARALTSARVTRLIEEADSPNATVVVLAPPVLAYADALALVDRVDGVLIVCDPRAVHRADLVRIRELITGAGGTVLGAVTHSASRRGRRTAAKSGHRGGGGRASGRPAPPGAAAQPPAPSPVAPRVPAGDDTVALGTIRTGDR